MKEQLSALLKGAALSADETFGLFETFVGDGEGRATDAQIGAYLAASAHRPPTAAELLGAAQWMRKHMLRVDTSVLPADAVLVDTCGTGGSGLNTFNTSTLVAFVAAGAGLYVPKHGNRAATSLCGSADLLEALGVKLDLPREQLADCLRQTGFVFLFAPLFHPATKRVQGIRRELGFRTMFNYLGPLVNPAGVRRQLLGVSNPALLRPMAEALRALGSEHVLIVSAEDGLDELSIASETHVCELKQGGIWEYSVTPEALGFMRAQSSEITGAAPAESAAMARGILGGKNGARADLVALNAGAALYVGGLAPTVAEGAALAKDILRTGKALASLERVVELGKKT